MLKKLLVLAITSGLATRLYKAYSSQKSMSSGPSGGLSAGNKSPGKRA